MSAYNGSGVFTLTGPEYPAVAASLIQSAYRNALDSAIATGLSTAICRDGQSVITANIPFNGFKLTGVGAAAARTDAASLATIQDATGVYVAIVGGNANSITLTPTPAITAYAAGQRFQFIASGTNSTTVVVDVSSLGNKLVTKHGTTSLVSGDILSGALVQITYDGTRFQLDYAIAMTQAEIGLTLYPQTAAELAAGVTPTAYQYAPLNVLRYGDNTTPGTTDMTTPIINAVAVAAALGGAAVYFPAGIYKVLVVGDIPYGVKFIGDGPVATTLKKATAGTCFTVKAFYVEWRDLSFDADVATSTTYGTAGQMIDYPAGFSASDGRLLNVNSVNIDTVIRFAPDAGARHQVIGGYWIGYNTTAGSEGKVYQTGNGGADTTAMFRTVVGLTTDGQIDQTGSIDSDLCGVSCRRVITTSTTHLLSATGGIWGSLGVAVTIDGQNIRIMGVRISGNITLAATMSGQCAFLGNVQTSGTFTDSSPAQVCTVVHSPLSVGYTNINKQTITHSNNAEEVQTRRIGANSGDADTTLTMDQSQTVVMYNTALTALRTVNLPATGRNGFTFRVVRQAGATGAFNLNVGLGPLKALTAASQWCEVQWSAAAAAWVLTANGTL